MRLNTRFYLARSSRELSRILDTEGDRLGHQARVHLARMARALLLAAAENGPTQPIEEKLRMELGELLARDRIPPKSLDGEMASETPDLLGRVASLIHALRKRGANDEAARVGREAVVCLDSYRLKFNQAADDLTSGIEVAPEARPDIGPPSPETMSAHLAVRGIDVGITKVIPFWTQSSKEISLLESDGGSGWPRKAVMRREPAFSIVANSVAEEFDVLAVAHEAGLPVPRPLFAEPDPQALGARLIITSWLPGSLRDVTTIGPDAPRVLADAAACLAGLHRIPPASVPKIRAQMERPLGAWLEQRILACEAEFRDRQVESEPVMEAAFEWLLRNARHVDEDPVIVHGDYDLRNMLIEGGRLSGMLDWEFAKYGHRAEDLGYFHDRVTQLMEWDRFMRHYEEAGGQRIDPFMIQFHRVLAWTLRTTVVVTAYGGYWREQHLDYRLGSTAFVEYPDHLRYLSRALLEN